MTTMSVADIGVGRGLEGMYPTREVLDHRVIQGHVPGLGSAGPSGDSGACTRPGKYWTIG